VCASECSFAQSIKALWSFLRIAHLIKRPNSESCSPAYTYNAVSNLNVAALED